MRIEKVEKLVAKQHDIKNVIHIRKLKQALNYRLVLKKVHRVIEINQKVLIKFNKKAWLNPYIDMNIGLEKEAKNDFEKDYLKLMNNLVFGKIMEKVRKLKVFSKVVNKIALIASDDKVYNQSIQQRRMQIEQAKIQYVRKKKLNVTI